MPMAIVGDGFHVSSPLRIIELDAPIGIVSPADREMADVGEIELTPNNKRQRQRARIEQLGRVIDLVGLRHLRELLQGLEVGALRIGELIEQLFLRRTRDRFAPLRRA